MTNLAELSKKYYVARKPSSEKEVLSALGALGGYISINGLKRKKIWLMKYLLNLLSLFIF